MIRKSVQRFSEKIMRRQEAGIEWRKPPKLTREGRPAGSGRWRQRRRHCLVAALHLAALYALLSTEYGPFAITLSLLAWLFANCLVLLFLPRPGIAAALSLMFTVALIALSRFKFDIMQLSLTFLDFLSSTATRFRSCCRYSRG